MKEKSVKIVLIVIGILSLLWLVISVLSDWPIRLGYILINLLSVLLYEHPWILLGVACLFIGVAMPFKKDKKSYSKSELEENKQKKLWKALLITGIIICSAPLVAGIYDAIIGTTDFCLSMYDCTTYYGFKAFWDTFVVFSILLFPGYILGSILIILSIIKLKRKKK